ncbi:MAG: Holliday junction branch migration protein RuvA [Patescibacteria group bacterium]
MIAQVRGLIRFKTDRFVVVDVGGIGYRVFVSLETFKKIAGKKDEEVLFWTHLHVRENIMDLYGFLSYAELEFFEQVIQVSGVGPKSGLAVLSIAPLDILRKAIASGETSYLIKVSGIGKRLAEKIVVELRDKLSATGVGGMGESLREEGDALEALHSLGYSFREGREALRNIPEGTHGVENIVKEALRNISKN